MGRAAMHGHDMHRTQHGKQWSRNLRRETEERGGGGGQLYGQTLHGRGFVGKPCKTPTKYVYAHTHAHTNHEYAHT